MFYLPESQTLQKRKTTVVICNVNQWNKLLCSSYNKREVKKTGEMKGRNDDDITGSKESRKKYIPHDLEEIRYRRFPM